MRIYSLLICFSFALFINNFSSFSQMRQVYLDNTEGNEIYKMSFYEPQEGYIGFRDWIGYTIDSGKTYTKKFITAGNVDYNGYSVNLTFGFEINGVKAFDQNTLIAYGDYGLVPAILYSTNGGSTFKLVFHSQFDPFALSSGVTDMIFPQNGTTGYAVDADRVLKTTDKGLNWSVVKTATGSFFNYLEAPDNNNVFAFTSATGYNVLLKTSDGGSTWQALSLPFVTDGILNYAFFLNSITGWITMSGANGFGYVYKTINGGTSWSLVNEPFAAPFAGIKLRFTDANTGIGIGNLFTLYKTTDAGVTWEPLPRDNNYSYLGYGHNDIFLFSASQFWAGGGHGFLELTTNGGGTPLPKAYFKVDSTGYAGIGKISLLNYSKTGYTYKWIVNGITAGTGYNAQYTHNVNQLLDTIRLIVSNGILSDTNTQYQSFYPPVVVSSFTPVTAGAGMVVTITGSNFTGVRAVYFGNTPASGFTVQSSTTIKATVGTGATGSVRVVTNIGSGSLTGFTFIPPPVIYSFSPLSATAGTTVTIIGSNFNNASAVNFGGIPSASFIVVSNTQINATVPSGNDGAVEVVTPGGKVNLAGFVSIPTLSSFSPLKGTQGTILHITGTSLTNTTSVIVGGIPVLSFTVNSSISITAVVGAGASGNVVVTKSGGTSSKGSFTWNPPPVITSFNPQFGPVGTSVIINGTGFNPVAASNIVFFGNVKGTIASASATSLTVTVPAGAGFNYITVNNNNLVGFSPKPFTTTFANGGTIDTGSFRIDTVINTTLDNGAVDIAVADMDGDGKSDIVLNKYGYYEINTGLLFYRNVSTGSKPLFSTPVEITRLSFGAIWIADLDGDGKPDIINKQSVLRNTSTTGNLSFVNDFTLPGADGISGVNVKDIDADGKPDIVVSAYPGVQVGIYRNISEPGAINFAAPIAYAALGGRNLLVEDFDNDGKPDLLLPDAVDNLAVVMKNSSTKGNILFTQQQTIPGYMHANAGAGDFDGDGKTDIVFAGNDASKAAVFRNITTTGTIQFDNVKEFDATAAPDGIRVTDLDGDGKVDIVLGLGNFNMSALKNTSTSGNISFAPPVKFTPGVFTGWHVLCTGDFNTDGKQDVAVASEYNRTITVYTNMVQPRPFIQSFNPTIGVAGNSVIITGNNFNNVTAVSFSETPAASFIVNSPVQITAVLGGGATGDVMVTNNYGSGNKKGFCYGIPPVITAVTPAAAAAGTSVTITGNHFNVQPDKNTVYVGGIKTTVSAASATSLTVKVPAGITYDDITVTSDSLTAYSPRQFNLTFPGSPAAFSVNSFDPPVLVTNGTWGSMSDVDGDGKNDLLLIGQGNALAVARNTSVPGVISFAANILLPLDFSPATPVTGDLNGDGKKDILTYSSSMIYVMRNTSTPGNIAADPYQRFSLGRFVTNPDKIEMKDIDLDGRPDVLVLAYNSRTITIFRNISSKGMIQFEEPVNYPLTGYGTGMALRDVDGDGKPDIISSGVGLAYTGIYPNTSLPGIISFGNRIDYLVGSWPNSAAGADMDGDNKPDLVVSNINGQAVSVFRNTCTPGNFSFAGKIDFSTESGPREANIGDWDGDGKPDVITHNIYNTPSTFSIFKNNSIAGNVSLQTRVNFTPKYTPHHAVACDVDGDGSTDIVEFMGSLTTAIYRNKISSIATAVNDPAAQYGMLLYPNPVKTNLVIDHLKLSDQWQGLSVISVSGKTVLSTATLAGKVKFVLNMTPLPGGIYVVTLTGAKGRKINFRIVKL